jgi:hypothetical protein
MYLHWVTGWRGDRCGPENPLSGKSQPNPIVMRRKLLQHMRFCESDDVWRPFARREKGRTPMTIADYRLGVFDSVGAAPALPVLLQRKRSGPTVVAEILGAARFDTLTGAPGDDPVTDHLDPPLPVVGTTQSIAHAAEHVRGHVGPVLVAHEGRAVTLLDATDLAAAHTDATR